MARFTVELSAQKFGLTAKVTDLLEKAEFPNALYSEIKPNPTIENVQIGVSSYKESGADCIVTIGRGSSMDIAKAIEIINNNSDFADVRPLKGVAHTKNHAVFTTAATGMDTLTQAIEGNITKSA